MKSRILTVCILLSLLIPSIISAQNIRLRDLHPLLKKKLQGSDGLSYVVDQPAEFSTALASATSDTGSLVISTACTVATASAFPSHIQVDVRSGGSIQLDKPLTISAAFNAPLDKQVFYGDSAVTFAAGSVSRASVAWWGTKNLRTSLVRGAKATAGRVALYIPPTTLTLDSSVVFAGIDSLVIEGDGVNRSIIRRADTLEINNYSGNIPGMLTFDGCSDVVLQNFTVEAGGDSIQTASGVANNNGSGNLIYFGENINSSGLTGNDGNRIYRVNIRGGSGTMVHLYVVAADDFIADGLETHSSKIAIATGQQSDGIGVFDSENVTLRNIFTNDSKYGIRFYASGADVRNVYIDGWTAEVWPESGETASALQLTAQTSAKLEDVHISNMNVYSRPASTPGSWQSFNSHAVVIEKGSGTATIQRITIDGMSADSLTKAIVLKDADTFKGVTIQNFKITNTLAAQGHAGAIVSDVTLGSSAINGLNLINGTITGSQSHGISLIDGRNIRIVNTTIKGVNKSAVFGADAEKVEIFNLEVYDPGQDTEQVDSTNSAVWFRSSDSVRVHSLTAIDGTNKMYDGINLPSWTPSYSQIGHTYIINRADGDEIEIRDGDKPATNFTVPLMGSSAFGQFSADWIWAGQQAAGFSTSGFPTGTRVIWVSSDTLWSQIIGSNAFFLKFTDSGSGH